MMTEQAALAKKEPAAATAAAITSKPAEGAASTTSTADAEKGGAIGVVDVQVHHQLHQTTAQAMLERKHKLATKMTDVSCRFMFPVFYGLFIVVMFGSLQVYDHRNKCFSHGADWESRTVDLGN